jgi:hypothetical protein
MKSLVITGNEENYTEQQLCDRLRHLDTCIKAVASCRADHSLPPREKRWGGTTLGLFVSASYDFTGHSEA